MAVNAGFSALRGELETLEAETFEIVDYAEVDEQLAGDCCSTSSTSTSSTSSTSSTTSSSG